MLLIWKKKGSRQPISKASTLPLPVISHQFLELAVCQFMFSVPQSLALSKHEFDINWQKESKQTGSLVCFLVLWSRVLALVWNSVLSFLISSGEKHVFVLRFFLKCIFFSKVLPTISRLRMAPVHMHKVTPAPSSTSMGVSTEINVTCAQDVPTGC